MKLSFKLNNVTTETLGFHLNPNFSIQAPQPKIYTVEIPFSSHVIDLTESFGEVAYQQRQVNFTLEKLRPKDTWYQDYSNFVNQYNGRLVQLVAPYDDSYYFKGRVSVAPMRRGDHLSFDVSVLCEPYRYKQYETVVNLTVTTGGTLSTVLINSRKRVIPTITVSASTQVVFGSTSTAISAGTYTLTNIVLVEGDNPITFNAANGTTITITYQEGAL